MQPERLTMRTFPLLALLLIATPAAAQSRLYTNADLTPTPVTRWTRTVTAAELASLEARQFRLASALPDGPTVIFISDRVEPQPLSPWRPLSEPWTMTAYVGRSRYRSAAPVVTIGAPAAHSRRPHRE